MVELTKLQKQLFELQDLKYRDFHSKLMPETDKEKRSLESVRQSFEICKGIRRDFGGRGVFCGSFRTDTMKKIIFT